MDDTSDPQYAYERGMTLYNMGQRYIKVDLDYAGLVVYWLKRYIDQEENDPACVKECRYLVAKIFSEYPELREEFKK